jgi:RHS repeat-associated protein
MDNLTYSYATGVNNRLTQVSDAVANQAGYDDIRTGQGAGNYTYDAIGNLTGDVQEGISAVQWTVYGKIAQFTKGGLITRYAYDGAGNRILKMLSGDTTVYVRDASGNVMAVYRKTATDTLHQSEVHVYGSSRLGIVGRRTVADSAVTLSGGFGKGIRSIFTRGEKVFEISNHLGNVLTTVSDRKVAFDQNIDGTIDFFRADVVSAQDYYAFGMIMPGRKFSAGSSYRYGFGSQEKDDEISGSGNSYTAEYWQYDSRLGRRWNTDPIKKHNESSYACFSNNPIFLIDPTGADTISINNKGKVSGIIAAKGNHVLLDHNRKQLQFNDPEYDTELINKRGIKVGDQLVNYISEKNAKKKVDGQGKVVSRIIAKALGETTPVGSIFYLKSLKEIKDKSYGEWDFSHSVLGPMVQADPNSNLGKTTRNGVRTYTDDYQYEQYYFFVFGNSNRTYNLGDAGNFMWGMAGQRSGFTWIEIKFGSNLNELRQLRGFDSDADQSAIKAGFNLGK